MPAPAATPWASPPQQSNEAAPRTSFVTTLDSDEWVQKSIALQRDYQRVLVVAETGSPEKVRMQRLELNARGPTEVVELPVTKVLRTLQAAADEADGGDLVAVLPGRYAGFSIGGKRSAGDGKYVHFRAMGAPGEVTIDRPAPDAREWLVYLRGAHHIVVQGFHLPGARDGARAGIMLDGDFGRTGRMTHHVVIANNYSHHHRRWGLHATDTHTVLMQDNLFAHSAEEHSAYVSDGSDDYVIRRNVFFKSRASGLQINLDPVASFEELRRHPGLARYPAGPPSREWALGLLAEATRKFGLNAFPDGRGHNFIIEQNVIYGHGEAGGAALNFAALSDSVIQNNLLYANVAGGIAQWDDDNPYDKPAVQRGPRTAAEYKEGALPLFGCRRNLVRNNTVLLARQGRAALQSTHGSFGTRAFNNVLINDRAPSLEVSDTSIPGFEARQNLLNTIEYDKVNESLKTLAKVLPEAGSNVTGVSRARFATEVVRYGEQPWVVLEGSWWRLNPMRPDFRPRRGSRLLVGVGDPNELPSMDLLGVPRKGADLGALSP
jgi:hypothetical protein